jgi:hypothetical protein
LDVCFFNFILTAGVLRTDDASVDELSSSSSLSLSSSSSSDLNSKVFSEANEGSLGSIDEAAALIGSGDSSDLTLDFRFD